MMPLNRGLTLAVLAVCLAGPLAAQSAASLTLDQALAEAVSANLGLKAEGLKRGVKQRDAQLAWNKLYPQLTVGGGFVRLNSAAAYAVPVAAVGGKLVYFTPSADNLAGSVDVKLALSPVAVAAMFQTGIDYDNARLSWDQAAQKLKKDVSKLFYNLLFLKEQIQLTSRRVDNAGERLRQAQLNVKAGTAPELSALQAQVSYENLKPQLEDLKIAAEQGLYGLEALLGRQSDPDLKLAGSLDLELDTSLPPAEVLLTRFLEKRLDLRAARGQIRAGEGQMNILAMQLLPTIVVAWNADPTVNDPFNAKTDWLNSKSWIERSGSLAVMLNWRLDGLLPTSALDNQRADAADLVEAGKLGLAQLELAAKGEVLTLVRRLTKSADTLATLKRNVAVALQAYNLTNDAYKAGSRSLLEVQDSELQYQTAQLTLLSERQNYISAWLDLETALNTTREEIHGK